MTAPSPEYVALEMANDDAFSDVYEIESATDVARVFARVIAAERARVAADPDAAWALTVVAEADRIEAYLRDVGAPYDMGTPEEAAGVLGDVALDVTWIGLDLAELRKRAIHAAAWALVLDRRARAVTP